MLTGRPAISFAYDFEHYAGSERGLFYDLDHVFPGPVCRDFGKLMEALEVAVLPDALDPARAWRARFFFDHVDDASARRLAGRVKGLYIEHGEAQTERTEAA